MNLKLEIEFSKAPILEEVDTLKKQIDDMRPLPSDVEGRVMQKLRLDWNYNSNAIEGNQLNYGETTALLMHGITAKGKPLKDHLDIQGHNDAINFLLSVVKEERALTEADIRALHEMILVEPYTVNAQTEDGKSSTKRIKLGTYKTSPNHVETITGEIHYYATPEEIPAKMQELMEWYAEASADKTIHPVIIAALFHYKFVAIHPFDDGNGRLSRILMNLVLMRNGFPPVVIKNSDKQNYYSLLSQADSGIILPFIEYIAEELIKSLHLYLKAITGSEIDDDDDIDKEIALFKIRIKDNIDLKTRKSDVNIEDILVNQIKPLEEKIKIKAQKFADLFFSYSSLVTFNYVSEKSFSYNSLTDYFNSKVRQEPQNINTLSLVFRYEKLKSSLKNFDLNIYITIVFHEYSFKVISHGMQYMLTKKYHEQLTKVDENLVLKSFVLDFQDDFNRENQKPES